MLLSGLEVRPLVEEGAGAVEDLDADVATVPDKGWPGHLHVVVDIVVGKVGGYGSESLKT